ncbi:MAG: class I SAM-dependent methyltransferase [Gammaproteobacteria bacterium]
MAQAAANPCPLCGGASVLDLLRIEHVPVCCNVLYPDEYQARASPRGELALGYCVECAHLFNTAFDPHLTEYTPAYDSSLHYSPRFNQYAEQLAARLVERYALRGKRIVEIGCGKGDFLRMLCVQGGNRGFGFDRSFEPGRAGEAIQEDVIFFQEFYNAENAQYCRPDFVCFRHVLEHIQHPLEFLRTLRHAIGEQREVVHYCEVPNALFTLKDMGIWDLIYEHCAYFSLHSLVAAFTSAGFDVVAGDESFGGQFIWVEARPGFGRSEVKLATQQLPEHVRQYADAFAEQYRAKVQSWREQLARMARAGRRPVVWGGGAKGVTFLNGLDDHDTIRYVVDLNPHKQGRYVAGTGQEVVPPEFLGAYGPTDVIVMNPLYLDEITSAVRAMGLDVRVIGV